MLPFCTSDKSCICTTWIKWCRPVQTKRAVYILHGFNGAVLYKRKEQYIYYMDSMVLSWTNEKSCICTTSIKWCRPVQTTRAVYVLHGLNGAVLYKRQEQYMYYMDSMVSSCTNDKSCICTTWIKWCRPVQTTRAVYVLHEFNGTVLYKRKELYMYYMNSMVPSCTNDKSCICTTSIKWCRPVQTTRAVYVLHGLNGAVLCKRKELYMYYMNSMIPSCTNDKSCICTTSIKWCRPVQATRAVYVESFRRHTLLQYLIWKGI